MDERLIPLAEAFGRRANRFRELELGVAGAGWQRGAGLLELGCGEGGAAAHLAARGYIISAADRDERMIEKARRQYGSVAGCAFFKADARDLPFEAGSFDGAYAEAAFSGITEKRAVISELYRVLKTGGRVLLNDFSYKTPPDSERAGTGLPCLEGAQTMEVYAELFAEAGFSLVSGRERFYEFAAIVSNLCAVYGVGPGEMAGYLAARFGTVKKVGADVLRGARLSYCRLIFEKG